MNYHDVLAQLGISSAHPGGFAATVELVSKIPLKRGTKVLEIGCGTGRTACYLAKERKCEVTGIDIRPLMIEKAERRAAKEGVAVTFQCADACQLPFPDNTFNVVFAESVTVFLSIQEALSEYLRVLCPGGVVYDREMAELKPHPPALRRKISQLYQARQVPSFSGWIQELQKAGFIHCGIMDPCEVSSGLHRFSELQYPDFYQEFTQDALINPDTRKIYQENHKIMAKYGDYLGYAVFHGTKPAESMK